MPCLASFFDALSGVKKRSNFIPAITCQTSAFEPSNVCGVWLFDGIYGVKNVCLTLHRIVLKLFMITTIFGIYFDAVYGVVKADCTISDCN